MLHVEYPISQAISISDLEGLKLRGAAKQLNCDR